MALPFAMLRLDAAKYSQIPIHGVPIPTVYLKEGPVNPPESANNTIVDQRYL
jgi:hypothetical protein